LPPAFVQSIVPLVKLKNGNLCDVNNYRAITLSNAVTKILESLFLPLLNTHVDDCNKCQFGFKAGHSTGLCTNVFKNVISYYTQRGSHVFACFVDFSKAFDTVNYWKLFNKLLDDNINRSIVILLAYWYSHQQTCVRWKTTVSGAFCNGTRQGGVLSPHLFVRYIRELIDGIVDSAVGCNMLVVYFTIS